MRADVFREASPAVRGEIDVSDGIDPEAVARGRVEASQHLAALVENTDRRPYLADVGDLLRGNVDVRGTVDVAPLRDELPLGHLHFPGGDRLHQRDTAVGQY